jgi:hypothetical protein
MKKAKSLLLVTFILVFLLHGAYSAWRLSKVSQQCSEIANVNWLSLYVRQQDYFLSFSYALAVAFTIYAFSKLHQNIKGSTACVAGGLTLTSLIYISACFLIGCCGSPLLAVYLGLFGTTFLGLAKPLIAVITTISVTFGYLWIEKKCKICCKT